MLMVCLIQIRNFKATIAVLAMMMVMYADAGSIKEKPKAESLIYVPEVKAVDFETHAKQHCFAGDSSCLTRKRTIELGQKESAMACSESMITCLSAMKSVSLSHEVSLTIV
jgi:hypothetical protein